MEKKLLIVCLLMLFTLLSACNLSLFERFQPAYPREITPIFYDETISFALV